MDVMLTEWLAGLTSNWSIGTLVVSINEQVLMKLFYNITVVFCSAGKQQ